MKKKSGWLWPLGLIATSFAGVAMLFRGCWHRSMSWPVRSQDYSYQVCLGCGIKRLFDEDVFRAYGPYSYDFAYLIAWDKAREDEAAEDQSPPGNAARELPQFTSLLKEITSFPQETEESSEPKAVRDLPTAQERTAS